MRHQKFWPYRPGFSLVSVAIVLLVLLAAVATLRSWLGWPTDQSETAVLIGVLVLSLLPVALAILDVVIERGGTIEYGGAKIDFSKSKERGTAGITVSANIGVRGQPVSDSSTTQILDTLRQATANDIVVIDLEDGTAWWETRLFVLISGAVRLGRPDIFVFIARDGNVDAQFQGWAYAGDLMPHILGAHPQYARSLQSAWAAAQEWQLVGPEDAATASTISVPVPPDPDPTRVSARLAQGAKWMAFDAGTGLHNALFAEQLLQSDLGKKIESVEGPRLMSVTHLEELFRAVLHKKQVDLSAPADDQLEAFLGIDAAYLALTTGGVYAALAARAALSNEVLRALVKRDAEAE